MAELGEPLSGRELEVLRCVSNGASNKEIATELTISQNTVKVHLRNIFSKLGVSSRTEATTVAIRRGMVVIPGDATAATPPQEAIETELADESIAQAEPETAVSGSNRLNWRTTILVLLLILLLGGTLIGLLGLNPANQDLEPTAVPFVEQPIEETRWLTSQPLPAGRANMAVAAVGLNVYQIGGETAGGVVDSVSVYDTKQHVWDEVASKPTAVTDATAAVLFGEIYVPGGRLAGGRPTNVVEAYSPANNTWRPVTALPQPVAGGLALTDGSFLYLFGGWDGEQYLDTSYVYDPGADSWRPLPPLSRPRAFATGSELTGQLYVVGGFDGREELATCQFFDPATATWFDCPDMLLPRAGAGAAVLVNKLYVIGGGLNGDNEITFSELYDPNTQTWQVVNTPMLAGASAWTDLGVTHVEARIYALGGRRAGELLSGSYVYAPLVYQTFIPAASASGDD